MMIDDFKKLPYRPGAGICLFNAQGLVFVAERRDCRGAWQMPQGGIQRDEDPVNAVLREMKEEVGTDNARIIARAPEVLRYDFPEWLQNRRITNDGANGLVFRGKYRGQEQDWFALQFLGADADFNLSSEHEPDLPEFVAWKWVPLEETPALIVPFKRPVYEKVVAFFAPISEALQRGETVPDWSR